MGKHTLTIVMEESETIIRPDGVALHELLGYIADEFWAIREDIKENDDYQYTVTIGTETSKEYNYYLLRNKATGAILSSIAYSADNAAMQFTQSYYYDASTKQIITSETIDEKTHDLVFND
jgi:hypothetical protein